MIRKTIAVFIAILLGAMAMTTGASASELRSFSVEQQAVFQKFDLSPSQIRDIVIDSAMTYEQAIGDDSIIPPEALEGHRLIKPYLVVVSVVYHGYDGRVHLGQMVVHRYMVSMVTSTFLTMWRTGFPVKSVIPESHFGYDDQKSMAANNSSAYRPEVGSEHAKGSALDINPFTNPFDVTAYDPTRPIEPAGAHYDPSAKGAIVLGGAVQKKAAEIHLEWGGNWGNPNAVPLTDFFRVGYFDYQHFQLGFQEYDTFEALLPPGFPNS